VWGFKNTENSNRSLYVSSFDPDLGTPSWDPWVRNGSVINQVSGIGYNNHLFQFLFNRPVTVYTKTLPTVIDACLRLGGLLGFLKIFSSILGYIHMRMFKNELDNKYSPDRTSEHNISISETTTDWAIQNHQT
jgi:hypothetical protein